MFDTLRNRLSSWLGGGAAKAPQQRLYKAARASRLTSGWYAPTTSADAELKTGLLLLRNRSRQLVRDSAIAKRAKTIVINNVVGAGVGLQGQVKTTRDGLHTRVNDEIEREFARWARAENCHTGGAFAFPDLERAVLGEVFEAGEAFLRIHYRTFGSSKVPLALELIEPECLAIDSTALPELAAGNQFKLGVEVDSYGRAVAYWIRNRHPGEYNPHNPSQSMVVERVPAKDIIHLRIVERWPQTRGVPWLHAAANKLRDMDEYGDAELTAAKMSAMYFGTIESDPTQEPLASQVNSETGESEMQIEPGIIDRLSPGDKFNFHTPNRPNAGLDQFMRYLLREVAAGVGVSYESLSRDYSQSNYSSSRLSLLDDRDLWRMLQQWWVRSFREPLHRMWIERAVYARALPSIGVAEYLQSPEKFEAVRWKLRGWSWVDPTKEVAAYKEAVKAGFTTTTKVIELTGAGDDIEDVIEQRKIEMALLEEAGITVDTTVKEAADPAPAPENPEDDPPEQDPSVQPVDPPARVVSFGR